MALPTLTNPRRLPIGVRKELSAFVIQVNGQWLINHNEDGSHGDVEADTVDVEGDTAVGGDLTVTGASTLTGDVTAEGDVFVEGELRVDQGLAFPGEDNVTVPGAAGDLQSTPTTGCVVLRVSSNGGGGVAGIPTVQQNFPAGLTGRFHYLLNDTASNVTILHDSASATTTASRFYTPDGQPYIVRPDEMIGLWYDNADTRWRVIGVVHSTGTWTPTLAFGGASVAITYGTRTGTWTRVGNVVTVEMRLQLTANGSSSGAATVTGLPFTAANNPAAILDCATGMVGLTGTPFAAVSTTTLNLLQTTATARAALTEAEISDTADMRLGLTYRI